MIKQDSSRKCSAWKYFRFKQFSVSLLFRLIRQGQLGKANHIWLIGYLVFSLSLSQAEQQSQLSMTLFGPCFKARFLNQQQ